MAEKKTDARVRYTKMMIRNGFTSLLKEKSLAKVTVTDICARAGINRATFYSHYKDPMDLMESLENELLENIVDIINESIASGDAELGEILPHILSFIQSEADICLIFTSDLSNTGFVMRCLRLIENRFVHAWTTRCGISEELADELYLYGAMGSVGLLHKWLNSGCPRSAEYMADLIIKMFNQGASAFNLHQK